MIVKVTVQNRTELTFFMWSNRPISELLKPLDRRLTKTLTKTLYTVDQIKIEIPPDFILHYQEFQKSYKLYIIPDIGMAYTEETNNLNLVHVPVSCSATVFTRKPGCPEPIISARLIRCEDRDCWVLPKVAQ